MKYLIRIVVTSFILILILCLGFSACGSTNASRPEENFTSDIVPNMVECGSTNDSEGVYYYTIDKNTGVVYLSYDAFRRHAITVMLNSDGTPVTAEQLGIPIK